MADIRMSGWGKIFLKSSVGRQYTPITPSTEDQPRMGSVGSLSEMRAHLSSPEPPGDRRFGGSVEDHLLPQAQ